MSLRQIANVTKISISALEALERNDVSRLPGGVFTRAFVRSYALEVGLDPGQAIQDFVAQFPNDSVSVARAGSDQIEDNQAIESDRRMASTVLRLLLVSVPIAGLLLYLIATGPRPADAPPTRPATPDSAATPSPEGSTPGVNQPQAAEVSRSNPPAAPSPATADQLVVGLSATAQCWVTATADGQQVIFRELTAGEQQSVEAKRVVVLTIGDAGALNMVINGMPAKPLGRRGQVVVIRINANDFQSYLVAR